MNELWQVILVVLAIVVAWSGVIILALRIMFTRTLKGLEKEISKFGETTKACTDLEREFLEFKAEMPLKYVMREDFIRFEVGINYKLDKLRDLFVDGIKENYDDLRRLFSNILNGQEKN